MLSTMKNLASKAVESGAMDKAIDKLSPEIKVHLEKINKLKASEVSCDSTFTEKFIKPVQIALLASTYGVTKLIPRFDERFAVVMLHTRDEVCQLDTETDKVTLALDAMERLPQVLQDGFKKSQGTA